MADPISPRARRAVPVIAALVALGGLALSLRASEGETPPRADRTAPQSAAGTDESPLTEGTSEARPAQGRGCRFDAGARLAYEVSVAMEATRQGRPERLAVDGRLQLRFVRAEGERATLAAGFTDLRVTANGVDDPARARAASGVALVDVDRRCRFTRVGIPTGTGPGPGQLLRGLILGLEVVLSDGASTREWTATQRDVAGAYEARYRVEGDVSDPGAPVVRQRLRFLAAANPVAVPGASPTVRVTGSQTRFRMATRHPWLEELDARESLRMDGVGPAGIELTVTTRLRPAAGTNFTGWASADLDPSRFDFEGDAPRAVPSRAPADDPALAGMPTASALERYRSLVSLGQSGIGRAAHFLAAYFRARPAAIGDLLAMVRSGRLTGADAAPVYLALQLADTQAARDALTSTLRDGTMPHLERERAAVALCNTGASPRRETVDALAQAARAPRTPGTPEAEVSDTALRTLGVAGQRARATDPALSASVTRTLVEELRRAGDDERRSAAALDGLGNTSDDAALGVIAPWLSSPSEVARRSAVDALRSLDPSRAQPLLAQRYGAETNSSIRSSIALTLRGDHTRAPSAAAVELAIRALPTEADRDARAALITLLGAAAPTHPGARSALVAQWPRETDLTMQRLLGRFLRAEELS